jgi:hypothetical protein
MLMIEMNNWREKPPQHISFRFANEEPSDERTRTCRAKTSASRACFVDTGIVSFSNVSKFVAVVVVVVVVLAVTVFENEEELQYTYNARRG